MTEYDGHFIATWTGKKFHYMKPQPEEICIEDIAHALSLKCRFGGHCNEFYSVGEHSIRVANYLPDNRKLEGLLHDATEAYWPDVARPIKRAFGLEVYEEQIWTVIAKKFGVCINGEIHEADDVLIATEARDLGFSTDGWAELPLPLPERIYPSTPKFIESMFLEYFYKLTT